MTLKKLTDFYQQTDKMPAPNGRFCESGGVARPTLCVEQPLPLSSKPRQYPRPRKAAKTLCASGGHDSVPIRGGICAG